ncbi:hypothetical protein SAMN02745216_05199 [Desulfatibacillum alkenivorans DSM 16219]|jgi:hypothetical protein|uniref:Metallopeptidase domain-containing protein n=1 Tax=Desulfatibacillum alkenivorans DSM 16219 TaxID=1121393 RepID=A0A1M7AP09_9BACT|nr:hypothetical protein [Desulfatibacillum alkenivorans]SHL44407.1 hypothetical protein SAMN02745216_05199 [Desulfatibacillum alkenivorans DSM 16219]
MNPLLMQMDRIKTALRSNAHDAATNLLVNMLASDDLFSYWSMSSQGSERIPNILRYVSRITFDPEIPTACVNLIAGEVRLSPTFFLEHMTGPEDVLFILLHERNHLILHKLWPDLVGHEYPPALRNWAEDVYINAMARRQVLSTLPERFYAGGESMQLVLTGRHSAVDWDAISYRVENHNLIKNAHASFYVQAAELMAAIHEPPILVDDFSGFHQWMHLVLEWWKAKQRENRQQSKDMTEAMENIPPLVANHEHGPVLTEMPANNNPDRQGVEMHTIPDISPNDPVVKMILATCEIPEIRTRFEIFNDAKVRMVETLIGGVISQRTVVCEHEGYSITVPPTVNRRDAFHMATGAAPVLWQQFFGMEKPAVDLYVDVSGSMSKYYMFIPYIYQSILHVVGRIFQFSTKVVEVDHGERFLFTTGGTSFNVVAEHMVQENVRWAILVSDGLSALNSNLERSLARQLEHLVYLKVQHNTHRNWERLAKDVVLLEGGS